MKDMPSTTHPHLEPAPSMRNRLDRKPHQGGGTTSPGPKNKRKNAQGLKPGEMKNR